MIAVATIIVMAMHNANGMVVIAVKTKHYWDRLVDSNHHLINILHCRYNNFHYEWEMNVNVIKKVSHVSDIEWTEMNVDHVQLCICLIVIQILTYDQKASFLNQFGSCRFFFKVT